MDIAVAQLVNLAAPATAPAPLVPLAPPADALATERFASAMAPVPQTLPADAVADSSPVVPVEGASLGDAILGGLQNLSTDFKHSLASIQTVLDQPGSLGMSELLKMQMHMVQLSLNHELMGKVVSRTTQDIDQLVKLQ